MSLLDTLPFEARVRIYQAMDDSVEQIAHGLDSLRGLGIESRWIKGLAVARLIVGRAKRHVSPHEGTISVESAMLKRLAFALYQPKAAGWNRYGSLWAWCESGTTKAEVNPVGHLAVQGGEAALWAEVCTTFAATLPAALLSESMEGARVTPDRPTNVRTMTTAEHALAERIRGYVDNKVPVSMLLYGPQGSAKTTAACSIARLVCGSYFRLSASSVCDDVTQALVALRPAAVIIDDIDRVCDVELLDLLDALASSATVVICTSNTDPDDRHGGDPDDLMDAALVRSARMDIHHHIAGLPPEAHAQIRREQGLTDVDLGPRVGELLASDLITLGRRQRARDLHDPAGAVKDLLRRRTNTTKSLRAVPKLRLTPAPPTATARKD